MRSDRHFGIVIVRDREIPRFGVLLVLGILLASVVLEPSSLEFRIVFEAHFYELPQYPHLLVFRRATSRTSRHRLVRSTHYSEALSRLLDRLSVAHCLVIRAREIKSKARSTKKGTHTCNYRTSPC